MGRNVPDIRITAAFPAVECYTVYAGVFAVDDRIFAGRRNQGLDVVCFEPLKLTGRAGVHNQQAGEFRTAAVRRSPFDRI
jgi:hypothetical protein